ncbi:MAG: histone deacetylase family protein [Chloroflexi bacterium]|nr:histone deacetylase family protein [Chloroflexota bacterium]MBP8055901.1 histone deacetylase family protein [Chloroflexota bacterium]
MRHEFPIFFLPDQHLHNPQTQVSFGQSQLNPEQPYRAAATLAALRSLPHIRTIPHTRQATDAELLTIHSPELVHFLAEAYPEWAREFPGVELLPEAFTPVAATTRLPRWLPVHAGHYCLDTATPIGPHTNAIARQAAALALDAAETFLTGENRLAYALCRPPGHHAMRGRYGGYCYFNNAALAGKKLAQRGRVAILDVDYHHGNGTQEIFYASDEVLFLSIHADPDEEYPYFSGYADEIGAAAGTGYNRNYPLPLHTTDWSVYRPPLEAALNQIVAQNCWCIVVSFGLDAAATDALGKFKLTPSDFQQMGQLITRTGLPVLAIQEGGYSEGKALGEVAAAFVSGLATINVIET